MKCEFQPRNDTRRSGLVTKECLLIVFCHSATNQAAAAAAADLQTCGRQQVNYQEQPVQRRPASVLIMAARQPEGEKITQGSVRVSANVDRSAKPISTETKSDRWGQKVGDTS